MYYVILCVICISKKLKYLKNEARDYQKLKDTSVTYSVILSVLSNKTNLILTGFAGIMRLCECDNLHVTRQTLQLCMMKILCGWKRIKEKAERKKKSLKYKPKITFPIQHLPE